MIGGMPEERDELEQAWQALTERERLVQQTMGRRSAEIDARARRFDEIAADLDARRQLIEDAEEELVERDRKSTRLNSSHPSISYAVFCLKKKKNTPTPPSINKKKKKKNN